MTSTSLFNNDDRRTCRRAPVQRPCKIQDPRTGKYIAATTIDLSQHGILVQLRQPSNLKPGDNVLIGVAMNEHQGIIQAKEMIESRIVRRLESTEGEITLAVHFLAAMEVEQQSGMRKAA